ncbi:MAG TPA: tetratricopeptide repeat protein [Anaerolineae bacterium]|jgi:tetratricopeptide (TPR) repeat protein|nr:tetratricopeptide repeat protein [Anaerolineae bacterium]
MNVFGRLFFRVLIFALIAGIVAVVGLLAETALVGVNPKAPRTYIERAYMDAKDAVKADPKNPNARTALAKAYIAIGQYNKAVEQGSIATRLDRESVDAHLTLGIAQNKAGQYANAAKTLRRALTLKGGTGELYGQAWLNLGQAYESQGKMEDALAAYKKASFMFSEDINVSYVYARALEKAGKLKEAVEVYEDIVMYVPDEQKAKDEIKRLNAALESKKKESTSKVAPTASGTSTR